METRETSKYFRESRKDEKQNLRRFIKIEEESNEIETKRVKIEQEPLSKPAWYPNNWQSLLKNIKCMRSDRTAVVDSQGCERTADPKETAPVKIYRFFGKEINLS